MDRVSAYGKIGLKASFVERHPQFFIHQGNHAVSSSPWQPPALIRDGSNMLHLPVRSLDRLRYKLAAGVRAYRAMMARDPGQRLSLVRTIGPAGARRGTDWINGVISRYGEPLNDVEPIDPIRESWDVKFLPSLCQSDDGSDPQARSLAETIEADSQQIWTELATADGVLRARLEDNRIVLQSQPVDS